MSLLSPRAQRLADQPIDAHTATRTLALTTSDATVDLPAGVYEVYADATAVTAVGLGVATTGLPSSTETAGLGIVPPSGAVPVVLLATTTVHARCLSGTGTLYLIRKAVT